LVQLRKQAPPAQVGAPWGSVGHAPQFDPLEPHSEDDCVTNGTHAPFPPPLQQPFAQSLPSHVQDSLTVSHTPFAQLTQLLLGGPHAEADSVVEVMHAPVVGLQQPFEHATEPPHWPHELHVSDTPPTHCVAFGVQIGTMLHEQAPQAQPALHVWVP
jgi:hypothetical protein